MKRKTQRHGYYGTKVYKAYRDMLTRCYNPNNNRWHKYGERGIKVCDSWNESFANFLNDMGLPPTDKHSLDRINVDGNYEPSNCKWSTLHEQSQNRTRKSSTGYIGVYKVSNTYFAQFMINRKLNYIGPFKTAEDAYKAKQKAIK